MNFRKIHKSKGNGETGNQIKAQGKEYQGQSLEPRNKVIMWSIDEARKPRVSTYCYHIQNQTRNKSYN